MSSDEGGSGTMPVGYRTALGHLLIGTIEDAIERGLSQLRGEVDLILTSPPFPLNRKKKYGNLTGDDYIKWLAGLAPRLTELLTPTGSIVVELGNAWEPGRPVMSLLSLKALMAFLERGELNLCQEFVCHNPARLPSPVQWVNIKRIRVKDSYTHVWWMAPTDLPKADNRRVLTGYSPAMQGLLKRQSYNSGKRPSGFDISENAFLTDNGGAIPPNLIEAEDEADALESTLAFANTTSNDPYSVHCREESLAPHPARMPAGLPRFFIKLLTEPGDLVLDPFGGSNMTGAVAEELGRRWITVEPETDYVEASRGRFTGLIIEP
jgi:site-specific DNA-methyltransferase (cytosine-N4-specific)